MLSDSLLLELNDGPFFYAKRAGDTLENNWYFCYGDYDTPSSVQVLAQRVLETKGMSESNARVVKSKKIKMADLHAFFAEDRKTFIEKAMRDGAPDSLVLFGQSAAENSAPLAVLPVAGIESGDPRSLEVLVEQVERLALQDVLSDGITKSTNKSKGITGQGCDRYVVSLGRKKCAISSLDAFAMLASLYRAPPAHWIAKMLDPAILSEDAQVWRAPSSWEIRHVVGEHSLIGISSVKTSEMMGVTPANFRKYMASGTAKNRHAISFSTWHLLLHLFGVKRFSQYLLFLDMKDAKRHLMFRENGWLIDSTHRMMDIKR